MKFLIVLALLIPAISVFAQSDTTRIRQHMQVLTQTAVSRNYQHPEQLDEIAEYLFEQFALYADTVYYQPYAVGNRTYKNVIAVFGPREARRTIIGAHYDVCGEQDGADDNASGTTGLLELARLLDTTTLSERIDLVAYTLEEPPFFRTDKMGSYIHATSLVKDSVDVKGMICLEMIGYFKDEKRTQDYPLGFLKLFYGSRGNYITLVNKFGPGKFARKFTNRYKHNSDIRTKRFKGPKALQGIDFSDHLNYWKFGISALMITDTAFYRNKEYHGNDTLDRLDLARMAKVIDGVYVVISGS